MAIQFNPKEWAVSTGGFLREVKAEMKKVSWPSRQEVVGTTAVVLIAVVIFGAFLGTVDYFFYRAVQYLLSGLGAA